MSNYILKKEDILKKIGETVTDESGAKTMEANPYTTPIPEIRSLQTDKAIAIISPRQLPLLPPRKRELRAQLKRINKENQRSLDKTKEENYDCIITAYWNGSQLKQTKT